MENIVAAEIVSIQGDFSEQLIIKPAFCDQYLSMDTEIYSQAYRRYSRYLESFDALHEMEKKN